MYRLKAYKNVFLLIASLVVISVLFLISANGANERVVFIRDGGNGDGATYESALGDFKQAVKTLADTGGTVVVCGRYTYAELIALSERSGTANGNNLITVTSVYGGRDYRTSDNAALCAGNSGGSANMVLNGDFVFKDITIVTDGTSKARAIICNGYDVVFGQGIVCKKQSDAPYISIVGGGLNEGSKNDSSITVLSGTYNYVCAGSRNGAQQGGSRLVIDGGSFEGDVSVSGVGGESGTQIGDAELIINGGTFSGDVGALTAVDGSVDIEINDGLFKKSVKAYGYTNNVDVNGGNLEGLISLTAGYPDLDHNDPVGDETGVDGTKRGSVISINAYNGDVGKLVEKISGEQVRIVVKDGGGYDKESEVVFETKSPALESEAIKQEETKTETQYETLNDNEDKTYILGSRENNILGIIIFGALAFLALVTIAYRVVHGIRKNS